MTTAVNPWRQDGSCPACGAAVRLLAELPWPKFRHIDFSQFAPGPSRIFVCDHCGMGGVDLTEGMTDLKQLFVTESYIDRPLLIHHVRPSGSDHLISAPEHQVDLLQEYLPPSPRILDIGCFDGRLLRAFQSRFPSGQFVGYDVGERSRQFFVGSAIEYVAENLDKVEGQFDLVTMSHSLQYEPDLTGLFKAVDRLLDPNGTLFVQVPDVRLKPTGLLLGDLHHHFTETSLINLVRLNGFNPQPLKNNGFPRDAILVARRENATAFVVTDGADLLEQACLELDLFVQRIRALCDQGLWYILGTTIDAAFVFHILGSHAGGFIDEISSGDNQIFQGMTVRHPGDLGSDERAILPLGLAASNVLNKFRDTYDAKFLLI